MSETESKPVRDYVISIGAQHYATKEEFLEEAKEQGVSRRLPSHALPEGLTLLGSRIWLAHGLGHKNGEEDVQKGVIFGYFMPSAIQFIAGPDGEAKYADIIADLKGRTPDAEVISYTPETTERKRKCGYRKVGGTYVVATMPGEGISPITILDPPQEFVGHSFRGLLELSPDQVASLEAGKGLHTLVEQECMECGGSVLVSPSTVEEAERSLRQIAKGREPRFVLRCESCRAVHRTDAVWEGKVGKLASYMSAECKGYNLGDEDERRTAALLIAAQLPRANSNAKEVDELLTGQCATITLDGISECTEVAAKVYQMVRKDQETKKANRKPREKKAA
jgi:hypothetical protein